MKLSCLAKSLILEQLLIILYASTAQLGGLCTSCRDLSLSLPIQYLAHTEYMNMPSCWFTHPDACVYVVQMRLYILSTHTHTHTPISVCFLCIVASRRILFSHLALCTSARLTCKKAFSEYSIMNIVTSLLSICLCKLT